jgi:phosphoglycolate phosphatase-like HAD superfamily hydrolase
MKRVRVFDFEGVIVDSLDAHAQFYIDVGEELGFKTSYERLKHAINHIGEDFWKHLNVPENLVDKVRVLQTIRLT